MKRLSTRGQAWLDDMFVIDDESDVAKASLASSVGLPASTGNPIRSDLPTPIAHPPHVVAPSSVRSVPPSPDAAPTQQAHRAVAQPSTLASHNDEAQHADAAPDEATSSNVCPIEPTAASEDWKDFKVSINRNTGWWMGASGIIDARVMYYTRDQNLSEGSKHELAVKRCNWALDRHACEFKVTGQVATRAFVHIVGGRWPDGSRLC